MTPEWLVYFSVLLIFSLEFASQKRKSSSLPKHFGAQATSTQRHLIDDSVLEEATSLTAPEDGSDDGTCQTLLCCLQFSVLPGSCIFLEIYITLCVCVVTIYCCLCSSQLVADNCWTTWGWYQRRQASRLLPQGQTRSRRATGRAVPSALWLRRLLTAQETVETRQETCRK